jgi:transposase-like protein
MSRSTISTFQLSEMFPDAESARQFLETCRWPNGPVCPICQEDKRITAKKGGYYRCLACMETFTIRTKSVFERSHIPLHKWLHAIYRLLTARKGISSMQLAKEIGIRQASAWFMLHRLRTACGNDPAKLLGIVEVDEAYIGGKETNKHMKKRMYGDKGIPAKTAVVAMRERCGRTKAVLPETVSAMSLEKAIRDNVEPSATIHTDEYAGYNRIGKTYNRQTVNHSKDEYSRNGVTTNGVESVFALLKRGLNGVYHHASKKHLARYVAEFTFRLNDGDVKRHTLDRMASMIDASFGPRITYKDLIS